MKTTLLNCVISAEDYENIIKWYRKVFRLEILSQDDADYHYTDLGTEDEVVFGITKASDSEEKFPTPRANATLPQVMVSDIEELMSSITKQKSGSIVFGPVNEDGFVYAIIADPEGNKIWVVEEHKE